MSAAQSRNFALDEARGRKREIEAHQRNLMSGANTPANVGVVPLLAGIAAYMTAHFGRFVAAAQSYTVRRDKIAEYLRLFQLERGLRRPASKPDPLMAILFVMMCGLVEGGMAGALMIGEGAMLPAQGLMFGMVFAFVNIAVAVTGAFYGLRYALHSKTIHASNWLKRLGGWACFGGSLLIVLALIFTAARVRAVGSHHHIFSWDKVGFWEGFNDGFAVALLALVIISSFIAYAKGYSGFSDPVPGYTKARREAEDVIISEINALRDQYEYDAEEAFASGEDQALDAIDDAEGYLESIEDDLSELISEITAHNDELERAKAQTQEQADTQARNFVAVKRHAPTVLPDLGLEAFDALRLKPPALSDFPSLTSVQSQITDIRTALAELSHTQSDVLAGIADAHGAFLAASSDLDVISPPTGV